MSYLENNEGIKADIQASGVRINSFLYTRIKSMVRRIKKLWPKVSWIDVYLKQTGKQSSYPKKLNVRFGVPGPDLVASGEGYNWKTILKSVEKKVMRQLEKRKRQA